MKSLSIEIKWAIIFALATLAWMLMERLAGLHSEHIDKHAIYTNFFAIPAIALYVFALLDKRKNHYNGVMTYKQGLVSGMIITVIVAIISPLTQFITSTFITPEYFNHAIAHSVATGELDMETAESHFNLKNYIMMGFIGALVMGAVTSAIVAIFTRKKPARVQ